MISMASEDVSPGDSIRQVDQPATAVVARSWIRKSCVATRAARSLAIPDSRHQAPSGNVGQ